MSAWLCSHQHIAALVGSFMAMKDQYTTVEDPRALARTLYLENVRSVDHRYRHDAQYTSEIVAHYASHPVTKRMIEAWQAKPLTPGEFFKALACYEYQSCECEDWRTTEAFKLCDQMRGQVCARVPGYEQCPWGIDNPPPLKRVA